VSEKYRMDSKVVLITGTSSGFGFETAKYLSDLGYKVYEPAEAGFRKTSTLKYYQSMLLQKNQSLQCGC